VRDKTFVAVACGANMNFDRLRFVTERAVLGEAREAIYSVTIPEQPGSFLKFCELIGDRSVTEFNYRYAAGKEAHIFVGVEVADRAEAAALAKEFMQHGLQTDDLSDNETAKLHIRHLVGGHASGVAGERVFRFDFPERPGALVEFLRTMNHGWNITLFHYRNHGADVGRVLAGIDAPEHEQRALDEFLERLSLHQYGWVEETHNVAYQRFLGRAA
jgi:threonine dehydratase